jgi:hypothetical protein
MRTRLKKIFWIGLLSLAAIGLSAHLIWKYSGNSQWELIRVTKKGVKLYARKVPGETVKQFKGVIRVRTTLDTIMAASQDPSICDHGCYDSKMLERVSERSQFYAAKFSYPFHFSAREMVFEQRFSLLPQTRTLFVEVIATPEKLPPNACCVRVEKMHNTWQYTPVGNGEIELEYVLNMDDGGFFPYPLANYGAPIFIRQVLPEMQATFDKQHQKDPNVKFALLTEK